MAVSERVASCILSLGQKAERQRPPSWEGPGSAVPSSRQLLWVGDPLLYPSLSPYLPLSGSCCGFPLPSVQCRPHAGLSGAGLHRSLGNPGPGVLSRCQLLDSTPERLPLSKMTRREDSSPKLSVLVLKLLSPFSKPPGSG